MRKLTADTGKRVCTAPLVEFKELPEAEQQDLAVVAQQEGISLQDATQKYGWHSAAISEVERLGLNDTERIAFTRFTDEGIEIGSKELIDEEAVYRLESSLGVEVNTRSNLGYSEAELVSAGNEIHLRLIDELGTDQISTDIDAVEGAITVAPMAASVEALTDDESDTLPDSELLIRTLEADTELRHILANLPEAVTIKVSQHDQRGEVEVAHGGGHLTSCTAAWAVAKAGFSNGGLMTAAHCPNTQKYEGRNTLTYRSQMSQSKGDAQWHSSKEVTRNLFRYAPGKTRRVTSVKNPVLGQKLCVYGMTTKNTCDKVYKMNQCSGGYCGLVATHRHYTSAGDSGGPWFWGNAAYGVHHGYKTIWALERSLFTPARKAESGLGVKIKTS